MVSTLSAAAEMGDLERGMDVHDYVIQKGIDFDVPTTTMLITMNAKCREIEKAIFFVQGDQEVGYRCLVYAILCFCPN